MTGLPRAAPGWLDRDHGVGQAHRAEAGAIGLVIADPAAVEATLVVPDRDRDVEAGRIAVLAVLRQRPLGLLLALLAALRGGIEQPLEGLDDRHSRTVARWPPGATGPVDLA